MTDHYILTFYGDDFTGSTDVMETLEWAGVPTVLFLEPPDIETVRERFPHARAVGLAGVSRTMSPEQMDAELPSAFQAMQRLNADMFHYKVCSTFDSSATIGSIGRATDIGMRVFGAKVVPMAVGAPALKRYVAFSNLYARVGDEAYRLDRHPTMSKHPITPMTESDLRLHLGAQTDLNIAAVNLLHMALDPEDLDAYINELVTNGAEVLVFDTLDEGHLHTVGRVVWNMRGEKPVLLVGSSGLEYALSQYWNEEGIIQRPPPPTSPGPVDQLVVISGSAAPSTGEQIAYAIQHGFADIRLDSVKLADPATADAAREATITEALRLLSEGRNVLMYSAQGPDDPAIAETRAHLENNGLDATRVGSLLGTQQGIILRRVLEETDLTRTVVCGGDTCGYASRQLGLVALEAVIPVAPGGPLCRASSDETRFDGLEISLKGGQVGGPDYFERILKGKAS